jgi:hypothetical protein
MAWRKKLCSPGSNSGPTFSVQHRPRPEPPKSNSQQTPRSFLREFTEIVERIHKFENYEEQLENKKNIPSLPFAHSPPAGLYISRTFFSRRSLSNHGSSSTSVPTALPTTTPTPTPTTSTTTIQILQVNCCP